VYINVCSKPSIRPFRSIRVHTPLYWGSCYSISSFICMLCRSLFVVCTFCSGHCVVCSSMTAISYQLWDIYSISRSYCNIMWLHIKDILQCENWNHICCHIVLFFICPLCFVDRCSLFVLFVLGIALSVLLRYMDSDCPFGIFKLFILRMLGLLHTLIYTLKLWRLRLRHIEHVSDHLWHK
jgi:hypothetical protein